MPKRKLTTADVKAANEQKRALTKSAEQGMLQLALPSGGETFLQFPVAVPKCNGKEIRVKKTKTNEYLLVVPGQLAVLNHGCFGSLQDLKSTTPKMNFDFKDRSKTLQLTGAIVYPSNTYLFMRFSKKGKDVNCTKAYEYLIVFHSYVWLDDKREPTSAPESLMQDDIDWSDPPILGKNYSEQAFKCNDSDS